MVETSVDPGSQRSLPPPPQSRKSVVGGGLLICAILLPLMIYYRQQTKNAGDIQLEPLSETTQLLQMYSDPGWSNYPAMSSKMDELTVKFTSKCDNIEKQVDEAERLRCLSDPHLAAAIADPYTTPFVGPNPRLTSTIREERMHGVDVLLNDYEKNSLDPPDLRTKLIPLMRRTLTACWRYETSEGYEDLVKLDSQNPDPLYSYCLMKATSDYRLITQIFEKAKLATPTRPTHPLLRCLINSSAKKSNGDIPVDQQVIIVESFVDFVSHHQEDQANLSLLFASVKSMIDRSNAYVAIDLASQLDALKSPPCPEWIMQYFMSSIK